MNNTRKSALLYNLFPVNNWREVTLELLSDATHDDLFIHVALPWWFYLQPWKILQVKQFLEQHLPRLRRLWYSTNRRKQGETIGFETFRQQIDWNAYQLLSYLHSKGVSKRKWRNPNVRDWRRLMHYFVIERHELCLQAFAAGYVTYGCNRLTAADLSPTAPQAVREAGFIYGGNFVSLNLELAREAFLSAPIIPNYFGVEAFWGQLCPLSKAYSAHQSGIENHYETPYPRDCYAASEQCESVTAQSQSPQTLCN